MSLPELASPSPAVEEKRARLARLLEKRAAKPQQYPLSFAQQRLWFLDRLQPGNPAYNVSTVFSFYGPVICWAFAAALREIVRRHQTLRTRFSLVDGQPVQIVSAETDADLTILDLRALSEPRRIVEMRRFLRQELADGGFDLSTAPRLLRVLLIRMGDEGSAVAVTMPHIISDGWSLGIIMRELSALYAAFSERRISPLPELPIQYFDFAHWQRQWLRGSTLETRLDYWRRRLAGAAGVLELPTDRPRPPVQTFRGRSRDISLPRSLEAALLELASREGATLFMILLAAFFVLLHRYTLQEDISVGVPTAGRISRETEGLIGLFTNTLVLRGDLSANPSFYAFLADVRESSLGAVAHQDMPFEKLVEELQPARDTSRTPLFQVAFVLQNLPTFETEQRSLALSPGAHRLTSKFELTLEMAQTDRGLLGVLEYNCDLFDGSTMKRLGNAFGQLLEAIVESPVTPVRDLPVLSPSLRQQILAEWNASAGVVLPEGQLHALFEARAREHPDHLAAVHRNDRMTYGELDRRANVLARRLRGLGVGPEIRVAVCAKRSLDLLVALMAVLKAGGAYVPIDPAYPWERKKYLIEDSRAEVLVSHQALLNELPAHPRIALLESEEETASAFDETLPPSDPLPGNLAYVIYTSGSTGLPKGVSIEHRSATAMVQWARQAFSPAEFARVLAATSVCFDLSVFEIFVPLSWGGAVILAANALELPELPAAGEVTLINTVPSAIAELARSGRIPASVRTINLAGEPLAGALVGEIYRSSTVERVLNLYGPSEDTTYSTWALAEPQSAREPTIGRPLPGTRAYVLDRELRPLPVGVPGELCLSGAGLARGYLGRPDLTAERFTPDPFLASPGGAGERLYHTGDLARWLPDGTLEFLGRLDHQVKIRGFRIELGEVEALLRRHSAVDQVVVAAIPAPEGGRRLAAYVVTKPSVDVVAAELREHLRSYLPEPMVPTAFVILPQLPLTPNGKIDRKALPVPERAAAPALTYEAPRSSLERRIAETWQEVLGVDRVGVQDNFFDLGGHSLLMAQVQHRLSERLGRDISMVDLLSHASVDSLARFLARAENETADSDPAGMLGETPPQRHNEVRARLELLRRGGRNMDSNGGSE